MPTYVITVNMPGYLSESDAEPFNATPEYAVAALVDEADFQLGDEPSFDDEVLDGDRALVESMRGWEGSGDLLFQLSEYGTATIHLESYANGFGGFVTLSLADEQVDDDDADGSDNYPAGWMGSAGPA